MNPDKNSEILRVVLLGAGNVGTHLLATLMSCPYVKVEQVWSRTAETLKAIKNNLDKEYRGEKALIPQLTTDLNSVSKDADIYIISVPDKVVQEVAAHLPEVTGVVVHTSGSVSMETLTKNGNKKAGVFYPLQTFTRGHGVDLHKVQFFLEATDEQTLSVIERLCGKLGLKHEYADSDRRSLIHLAAVFACNFTNYMLECAQKVLDLENLNLKIFEPLMEETIRKAMEMTPRKARTGPAARKDFDVIDRQLSSLEDKPELREIYRMITSRILDEQEK